MKTPKSQSIEPSFPPQLKQHSLVFQLLLLCSSLSGKTNLKSSAKRFLLPRGPLSCVLGGAMAPGPTGARTGRGGRLGATCREVCATLRRPGSVTAWRGRLVPAGYGPFALLRGCGTWGACVEWSRSWFVLSVIQRICFLRRVNKLMELRRQPFCSVSCSSHWELPFVRNVSTLSFLPQGRPRLVKMGKQQARGGEQKPAKGACGVRKLCWALCFCGFFVGVCFLFPFSLLQL